ncbi:MAG: Do family serine endopeptidase [Rikenellaceae bacterium]|nr:Do family serine endopeptidase [Rikenellaceae bacterium]
MKRRDFFIGILAASVVTAGLTAYGVSKITSGASTASAQAKTIEFVTTGAGSHFTAYDRDGYPDLTYAAENAVQAVVNIENIQEIKVRNSRSRGYDPFYELFGIPMNPYGYDRDDSPEYSSRERRSGGSGVIISSDGYIVTNNHVIDKASRLRVTLNDDSVYDATLVGTDPTTDVALIKIEAQNLPTLAFGDSDALRLGEWVMAIGSPFELRSTVTAGIISAKARDLGVIPTDFRIESFIQTDAAVNPGNSGGALVNTSGELVGINTVIKSPTGSFAGYSFAVPSSIVKKVVVDLKEYGIVQRALLGIRFGEINSQFVEQFGQEHGITETGGLYVGEVTEGGAAEAAGVKEGDVITHIDGIKVDRSTALTEYVAKHRPNDKVTLTVKRKDNVKQIDVVLRNTAGKAELLPNDYVDVAAVLGASFENIDAKEKKKLGIDDGVLVKSVSQGGLLSELGIRKGYIITQINGQTVKSASDISKFTKKIESIGGVDTGGRHFVYRNFSPNKE